MVTQRNGFSVRPRYIWLALLALSVLLFFSYQGRKAEIADQQEELRALSEEFYNEGMRNDSLNVTLSQINTERYIEQQARKQFGYLMPDEIRFVLVGASGEAVPQTAPPQYATMEPTAAPVAAAQGSVQVTATPVPTLPPTTAPAQQEAATPASPAPATGEKDWSSAFQ